MTPPPEILYVWAFSCVLKGKEAPNIKNSLKRAFGGVPAKFFMFVPFLGGLMDIFATCQERIHGDWKGWFETAPWRATLATPSPALYPRILGTRFANYGLRMFWGELMVIWKGWFETVPCRATLKTPFSALCPRILGTRFTNYGLRVSGHAS